MRVGLVVDQLFAPVPGGTGRYAGELAAALTLAAPPRSFAPAVECVARVEAAGIRDQKPAERGVRASPTAHRQQGALADVGAWPRSGTEGC